MKRVTVLGATGSIGLNTLDVIARHPSRYEVFALSAMKNVAKMLELCAAHQPRYAVMPHTTAAAELRAALRERALVRTEVLQGEESLATVASHPDVDIVMAAIVGAAGLVPTLRAAQAGKKVLLANKEALVMSGALFMQAVQQHNATLLPIDSEHNAIFQCLPDKRLAEPTLTANGVRKIILTASGGPFRNRELSSLAEVTPDQACAHPNWVMGRKISVDSATMMNKGLEVIEAHWLFSAPADAIEVVVHPQSVIHSMVSYRDGSVIAQLGNPDMRTPIAYGLAHPERIDAGVAALDLTQIGRLEFQPLDNARFPCVGLAYAAMRAGGTAPTILNAANEVAVAAFLEGRLAFTKIAAVIDATLTSVDVSSANDLTQILQADAEARRVAAEQVTRA